MTDSIARLDEFRVELNRELAYGRFAETNLIVGVDGRAAVVASLDEERLPVLMRRVESVGGFANIFATGPNGIRRIAVLQASDVLDDRGVDDMSGEDEQPSARTTVGMFIDYLEQREHGVMLPPRLSRGADQFEEMPARQIEVVRP